MMNARRYLWLTSLLLAGILAACGGSGSSGFDFAENRAIDDALDGEQCVDFEGLMICPADSGGLPVTPTPTFTATATPVPPTPTRTPSESDFTRRPTDGPEDTRTPVPAQTGTPTGTPPHAMTPTSIVPPSATRTMAAPADTPTVARPSATPTMRMNLPPGVQTTLDGGRNVECEQFDDKCSFIFAFAPEGLPETAQFRIAQRIGRQGPWKILPSPDLSGVPEAPVYASPIEVGDDQPGVGETNDVQLVVLVFLNGVPELPDTVERLSDTGADFAFVTDQLTVAP